MANANNNKGVNSSQPTTAEVIGGVYSVTPPVLVDGQAAALQLDVNGKLITSGSGTGTTNITGINGSPPALANALPVELSDGTQAVGTSGNPLSVHDASPASQAVTNSSLDGTTLTTIDNDIKSNITLQSGTNTVGKVDVLGNAGVALDAVLGATKPANALQVGGNDGINAYAIPLTPGGASVKVNQFANLDAFGQLVSQSRWSQWEENFSLGPDATLITAAQNVGALPVYGNGGVTIATTPSASSSSTLTSVVALSYEVGFEWYGIATVLFTVASGTPGSQVGPTNSHQRIGFYNNTDGFWIGFEGGVWGITQFQNGVMMLSGAANSSPSIAITSFNGDQCLGVAGSAFTSGGSVVAIDFTKINLFRMRGGWLGTGQVVLEVCSPDGNWVTMHTFRNPNTLTTSYVYTTTWNYIAEVLNTSNTSNVVMYMGGAAFGSTDPTSRASQPITSASQMQTVRAVNVAQQSPNAYVPLLADALSNLKVASTSQPSDPMRDLLNRIFLEMKGIRLAVTQIACEGGKAKERDFDPMNFSSTGDESVN